MFLVVGIFVVLVGCGGGSDGEMNVLFSGNFGDNLINFFYEYVVNVIYMFSCGYIML